MAIMSNTQVKMTIMGPRCFSGIRRPCRGHCKPEIPYILREILRGIVRSSPVILSGLLFISLIMNFIHMCPLVLLESVGF